MGQTILGRKVIIPMKIVSAVAILDQEIDFNALMVALGQLYSWWTLDKIFIVTTDAYTGTFTFTVDVDDTANEIDRAKISSAIAAENQIEISELGLDGKTLDKLKIVSSAALTVGFIYLYMTFIIGN